MPGNSQSLFDKCISCFSQKKYDVRMVAIGSPDKRQLLYHEMAVDTEQFQTVFPSNSIHTARYRWWNFVPLSLLFQYRRLVNIYYLSTLILTFALRNLSPVDPITWFYAYVFVVLVTMVKEGAEDYMRYKKDKVENTTRVKLFNDDAVVTTSSTEVQVGDVVRLEKDDFVPCDCVILWSARLDGAVYVETSNLDGETSLKKKMAFKKTHQKIMNGQTISDLKGIIQCQSPNANISSFIGNIILLRSDNSQVQHTLHYSNLLLRGTRLTKTEVALAACIYSGHDTKLLLNTKIVGAKFSQGDRSFNKMCLIFFIMMFVETILFSFIGFYAGVSFISDAKSLKKFCKQSHSARNVTDFHWYFFNCDNRKSEEHDRLNFTSWVIMFLVWMLVCNYILPISLYFSLELQKFFSSFFFGWDLEMYDEKRDIRAKCSNSDVPQDLGLVTHVFTDKTGTLTSSDMVLQSYTVDGKDISVDRLRYENNYEFVKAMLTCHTVDVHEGKLLAVSTDEMAIMQACQKNGMQLLEHSDEGQIVISFSGDVRKFYVLRILPFDSVRKCMSVIVSETPDNSRLFVYCKGAETVLCDKLASDDYNWKNIETKVNEYSAIGNRILVFASKELSYDDYKSFDEQIRILENSVTTQAARNKELRNLYKTIEKDFYVTGATSIQDKLQEDVPDTIMSLKQAGILVWMLTGDKTETALAVAKSAKLVVSPFVLLDLVRKRDPEYELDQAEILQDAGVVISLDGTCLNLIKNSASFKEKLYKAIKCCQAVLASRLSPMQKCHLVSLIKKADKHSTTLAIGDGGNDVTMIQEAHLGIGIVGKEGTAASRAADFSFSKFKCLKRALLGHGHWNYHRHAMFLQFSFYKSVAAFTCMVIYGFFNNFSGSAVYDTWFLVFYNMLFCSLPILIYSITEQPYSMDVLLQRPKLYQETASNKRLSVKETLYWTSFGLYQSIVIFGGASMALSFEKDQAVFAHSISATMVLTVLLMLFLFSRFWNILLVLSTLGSIVVYFGVTFGYTEGSTAYYGGSFTQALSEGVIPFLILLLIVTCMLPIYLLRAYHIIVTPNEHDATNET